MSDLASRRMLSWSGLMLAGLLSLQPLAFGQGKAKEETPDKGGRFALLVGVRQYDPAELKNLEYAEADATALSKVLLDAGYKKENVLLMTQTQGAQDSRSIPLAANIRKELALLLEGRTKDDVVVIGLAGHGVQFKGSDENFFCPMDTKLANRETLISMQELLKQLEKCEAGLKLLFVDACRNDPQSSLARSGDDVKLESLTRPPKEVPSGGVAAFYSCSANQRAFEDPDLKHGVFFFHVIEGLRGTAARNGGSDVFLGDLEFYVNNAVEPYVRSKLRQKQQPHLLANLQGQQRPIVSWPKASTPVATSSTKGFDPRVLPGAVGPTDRVNLPGYASKDHTLKRVITLRQITNHRPAEAPKYSPELAVISGDGSKIAYFAPQSGIWTINPDGSEEKLVAAIGPKHTGPAGGRMMLSLDGNYVLWHDITGPLYRINCDGDDLRMLAKTGPEYTTLKMKNWGNRLYYGTRGGLYSIDTEGVGDFKELLTQKDLFNVFNLGEQLFTEFDVSERGTELACSIYDPDLKRRQLYAFTVGGDPVKELRLVVKTDFEPTRISVSPDGRQIYFGKYGAEHYVVNWDGSGYREVKLPTAEDRPVTFTPDGKWISYLMPYAGTVLTRLDGSERVDTTQTGRWDGSQLAIFHQPSSVSFSRDLRQFVYIMNYANPAMPRQLVVGEINPQKAEGLPVISDIRFSKRLAIRPELPNYEGELQATVKKGEKDIDRVQFLISPEIQFQPKYNRWEAEWGWFLMATDHLLRDDGTNGDEKAGDDIWSTKTFGRVAADPAIPGKYLVRIIAHDKTTFRGFEKASAVIVDVDGVELK